jgi:transcription elongation factor Elf1
MTCPFCKLQLLVEITTHIGDSDVTLHSCSGCGLRWWDRDGEQVQVTDVLELAAARR